MKKLKGLIFGMAVALPLFFGVVRPVHADNGTERLANHMQVSPASQQLGTLKPGEIKQGSFRVQNIGTNAFDFKIYAAPYSVSNESYDPTFDASSDYTKISNWFTFNTTSGHLDPNSEATIEYTVKVPQNAPGGGQYASIMVENASSENSSNTIREVTRIGMLIYSHIDGKINHCTKILENSLPFILFNPPISGTSRVENCGNTDEDVKYVLRVFPFFSKEEVYTNEENPTYRTTLPNTKRLSKETWEKSPGIGIFWVEQDITFGSAHNTSRKLVILCPIWLIVLLVLFILSVIFWLVSKKYENKKSNTKSAPRVESDF